MSDFDRSKWSPGTVYKALLPNGNSEYVHLSDIKQVDKIGRRRRNTEWTGYAIPKGAILVNIDSLGRTDEEALECGGFSELLGFNEWKAEDEG